MWRSYDQRSPQGLAGGVFGSVLGYEMGRGDPIAAGIGAAAGAFVGNRW
ncbi:MAG: glycine zipper 2TM domain-containing protein [Methylococcales bacterium]